MRPLVWLLLALALTACAETQRCPDAEVFDENGRCGPIPDAGTDGGPTTDGG